MLDDTIVLGLIEALAPWGAVLLLTGVGILSGVWYVRRFETDLLSQVGSDDTPRDGDDVDEERAGTAPTADEPDLVGTDDVTESTATAAARLDDGMIDDAWRVDGTATSTGASSVDAGPAERRFGESASVTSRGSEHVLRPAEPPPEPERLPLGELDPVVSRDFDPTLLPVDSAANADVDDPWSVSADDGDEIPDLSGFPTVLYTAPCGAGAIDEPWSVDSDPADVDAFDVGSDTPGVPRDPTVEPGDPSADGTGSTDSSANEGADSDAGTDADSDSVSDPAPQDRSERTSALAPGGTPGVGVHRRKLLGAMATIGSAAAFGSTATDAFLSDDEEVENNQLVAGSLDLKVDWEEHYSDWSDDEVEGVSQFSMEPGEGLVGFPSGAPDDQQSMYIAEDDVRTFLDNTAIEAFPDQTATSDPTAAEYDALVEPLDDAICDLPADLGDPLSHPYRTQGTFGDGENPQTTEPGDPLVDVSDLKPGDFGEVTFSLHLCGNPGYVWLTGGLVEAAENDVVEPELESDAEQAGVVELLDAVQVALWYDTGVDLVYGADVDDRDADGSEGDNFHQESEALIPLMGSLGSVLDHLESGMFPLDAAPITPVDGNTTDGAADGGVDDTSGATEYLSTEEPFDEQGASDLTCTDYGAVLGIEGLLGTAIEARVDTDGDGEVDTDILEDGMTFSACGGTLTVDEVSIESGTITVSTNFPVRVFSVKGGSRGERIYVWPEPGVILDGVEFVTPTNPGSGKPAEISNIDVCCGTGDGNGGAGGQNGARDCLPDSTTAFVGFEWWIPTDVGNEIQTDSVAFDLGFYTEQCRHNDGSGGINEEG